MSNKLNIFDMLKKDHYKVKQILEQMCKTQPEDAKKRKELLGQLKEELEMHEKIEERFFYPALQNKERTRQLTLEAYEEHHTVDDLLEKLMQLAPNDERWLAKLTVIKENLNHHIQEEEDRLFLKAEEEIDEQQLDAIAHSAQAMKIETWTALRE